MRPTQPDFHAPRPLCSFANFMRDHLSSTLKKHKKGCFFCKTRVISAQKPTRFFADFARAVLCFHRLTGFGRKKNKESLFRNPPAGAVSGIAGPPRFPLGEIPPSVQRTKGGRLERESKPPGPFRRPRRAGRPPGPARGRDRGASVPRRPFNRDWDLPHAVRGPVDF